MSETSISQVRSFNRLVAERVGAVGEDFLGRKRTLGESRILWEIGPDGTDVRSLRARFGLDSGYLSRLLRALEHEGLVEVTPDPADRRVRRVSLSRRGHREWNELESRSNAFAASILEPLSPRQRNALVEAMRTVERLLTASMIDVRVADPRDAGAQWCLFRYYAELDERFEGGFELSRAISTEPHELMLPAGLIVVAWVHGDPVGCGVLKLHGRAPAELKRMWVSPDVRGLGLGRRLLRELEDLARDHGATAAHLETNRALTEAIALYRASGYEEVEAFNDEPHAHHWFAKPL
jgi:DNA-binding MarR family transcriptional regulator/GNAT superfamily N-acetyltransferase